MGVVLDGLLELLAPTRCAGCEFPGAVLCPTCRLALPVVDPSKACPACGAPFGALVCTECWETVFSFEQVVAFGQLEGALARAVVLHKDAGERRLGAVLGGLLGEAVCDAWGEWAQAVSWIPPSSAALRRRGFDHGESIAAAVAQRLGVAHIDALHRPRALDQRLLGRAERLAQSQVGFGVVRDVAAQVLLVDDVMTTGATLDAASLALLGAGATEVRCGVVARAW